MDRPIEFTSYRRFGVEIELNTLDGIIKRPDTENGEIPVGSDYVARLIRKASRNKVQIAHWDHIHNNSDWIMKHDMSCGLEVNSPVLKGWPGLETLLKVIEAFRNDPKCVSDRQCSLHVHVNTVDLDSYQMAAVISHYIKCEHVFFDMLPSHRKSNRYCQMVGMTDWFDLECDMEPLDIISRVGQSKYGSINTFHFVRGGGFTANNDRRQTIEFRVAENDACLDPYLTKNWVRLLLHFVEVTKDLAVPLPYTKGDSKSGMAWLDFPDVYKLLKFDRELSPGMQQVRQWFMDRIDAYGYDTGLPGVWSNVGRRVSRQQFLDAQKMLTRLENDEDMLYGKKWIK